jgi:colicin import membrane protein
MKPCIITLIISFSFLSDCNPAQTVINTNQHEIADDTPAQVQKAAPHNSISVEPTESKKERALRELLSEDTTYQQAHTPNSSNPEDLFILYKSKIINNWTTPKDITTEAHLTLDIQMSADGTISSIKIGQTSGSYQFDNSAILAVRSVGIFSEVKGLSEGDYKKYFKFHKIKFSPPIPHSN